MASYKQKLKENEVCDATWNRLHYALHNGHYEWTKNAQLNDRYYLGGGAQWQEEHKRILNATGRPWAEFNQIFLAVNTLIGYHTQNRLDITFRPRSNKSHDLSHILNSLGMYILDSNNYQWHETEVFSDGVILGRGYFDIRMDFTENLNGNIKIVAEDPYSILPDPSANSYDPDTWADVIKTHWKTLEEVEAEYGTAIRKRVEMTVGETFNSDDDVYVGMFSDHDRNVTTFNHNNWYTYDKDRVLRVKVVERQYWKTMNTLNFVDPEAGDMEPVPEHMTRKEAKAFAESNGYEIIRKPTRKIRWVVCTKNVLFHDDWSPYEHFTIVPYFPYFRRGITRGIVDNMRSPQDILNKTISQTLHIVNTTANSGWMVEENSLSNMRVEDLENVGSKTGLVIEYKAGRQAPEKINANQIPTGLAQISEQAYKLLPEVSGVSRMYQGQKSNEVSGVAIQNRAMQNEVPLAVVTDSLNRTRHMLAKRMLQLVQTYYTDERIVYVSQIDDEGKEHEEPVALNHYDDLLGGFLNDITEGDYDIVVADVPSNVTANNAQFAQVMELKKFGYEIPGSEAILYTDLKDKQKLSKIMAKVEGLAEPSPEEQQMQAQMQAMEIEKLNLENEALKQKLMNERVKAMLDSSKAATSFTEAPEAAVMAQTIYNAGESEVAQQLNEGGQ